MIVMFLLVNLGARSGSAPGLLVEIFVSVLEGDVDILRPYDLDRDDTWTHCKPNTEMQMTKTVGQGPVTGYDWK
jgi:hypothetical protein